MRRLTGRLCKMQAFGIVFTLAGILAYVSQVREEIKRALDWLDGGFDASTSSGCCKISVKCHEQEEEKYVLTAAAIWHTA